MFIEKQKVKRTEKKGNCPKTKRNYCYSKILYLMQIIQLSSYRGRLRSVMSLFWLYLIVVKKILVSEVEIVSKGQYKKYGTSILGKAKGEESQLQSAKNSRRQQDRFCQRSEEERRAEGMLCNWEMTNSRGQSEGFNTALISEDNLYASWELIKRAGQKEEIK